jgi:hypothetical protein
MAVAGVALLLAVGLAGATTLVKMEFADLVREADHVVVGTVTGIEGQWEDTGRFIHTNVTLSVERSLKGSAPRELLLRTPGGEADGVAMKAHGAATFERGERVLVFLTTWDDGTAKVLGYVQGKSSVVDDPQGRVRLRGGVVDGRTLASVAREIQHGPDHAIPLRPVR